jgi:hypothetical protein
LSGSFFYKETMIRLNIKSGKSRKPW